MSKLKYTILIYSVIVSIILNVFNSGIINHNFIFSEYTEYEYYRMEMEVDECESNHKQIKISKSLRNFFSPINSKITLYIITISCFGLVHQS